METGVRYYFHLLEVFEGRKNGEDVFLEDFVIVDFEGCVEYHEGFLLFQDRSELRGGEGEEG